MAAGAAGFRGKGFEISIKILDIRSRSRHSVPRSLLLPQQITTNTSDLTMSEVLGRCAVLVQ